MTWQVSGRRSTAPDPRSTRGSGPAGSRCSGAWAGGGCSASSTSGSCWPWSLGLRRSPCGPRCSTSTPIAVAGNEHTTAEAVVAAAGHRPGRPAHRRRPAGRRASAVAELPWVHEAELHRGIDGAVVVDDHRAHAGRGGRRGRRTPCSWTPRAGPSARPSATPEPRRRRSSPSTAIGAGLDPGEFLGARRPTRPWRVAARLGRDARLSGMRARASRTDGSPGVVDPGIVGPLRRRQPARGQGPVAAHRAGAGRSHLRGHDRPAVAREPGVDQGGRVLVAFLLSTRGHDPPRPHLDLQAGLHHGARPARHPNP